MSWAALAIAPALLAAGVASAGPCDGIWQRPLAEATALLKDPALRAELGEPPPGAPPVEPVYEHMSEGAWHIIWIEPKQFEPGAYIVTVKDKAHFVAPWGGVSAPEEQAADEAWARALDPQFPPRLARCFAWYVTVGRYEKAPTWPNPFNRDPAR